MSSPSKGAAQGYSDFYKGISAKFKPDENLSNNNGRRRQGWSLAIQFGQSPTSASPGSSGGRGSGRINNPFRGRGDELEAEAKKKAIRRRMKRTRA